jgi:hypothetical protein
MNCDNLETVDSSPNLLTFIDNDVLPYPTKAFLKKLDYETVAHFHKRVINIFDIHINHIIPKVGSLFPSPALMHAFDTKHLEVKPSRIIEGGLGLFTKVSINKGDPIIIYGGQITDPTGTYSIPYGLQIGFPSNHFCVDANPKLPLLQKHTTKLTLAGRMNEYIWDKNKNNVHGLSNGLMVASNNIQANSELFLDYGEEYDWTAVGLLGVKQLAKDLEALTDIFKVRVKPTEIWEVQQTLANLTKNKIKNWKKSSIQWHVQIYRLCQGTATTHQLCR